MARSFLRLSLATALFFGAISNGEGTVIHDPVAGVYLLLADFTQPCSDACFFAGLTCSGESLEAGQAHGTNLTIAATISSLGGTCDRVRNDRNGKAFPLIDDRDFCYGSKTDRTNWECDFVSTMTRPGRRICSCFGAQGAQPTDPPSPTGSPTASPTESPVAASNPLVPSGYTLSWRDDFNGADIDTNNWSRGLVYDVDPTVHLIWNPTTGGEDLLNSNYDGYIRDEDSYVENGMLMLANRAHDPPITGTSPSGLYDFSSGWINSLRKRYINGSKKPVYVEIRANIPQGPKVWPAIWLVTEARVWPPEIDIWEYFGVFFNPSWGIDEMHFRNIWSLGNEKVTDNTHIPWHATYSGFTTLGWLWTDQEMTWYVNGVQVHTKVRGVDLPSNTWTNQDMSFILNNGLMSQVAPDLVVDGVGTTFPNYMMVDYVAVYEGDEVTQAPSPAAVGDYEAHLGAPGESCTNACARFGATCSVASLAYGDVFATPLEMPHRVYTVGSTCSGGMFDAMDWDVNPQVSTEGYCFPVPDAVRSNHDCDATSALADAAGNLTGQRICTCDGGTQQIVAQYEMLLGDVGESCTSACSRNGATCSVQALVHGDAYASSAMMEETTASVGSGCNQMHSEQQWAVNPQVSITGYCFPVPQAGRTNHNCDANENGNLAGRRICTCEVDHTQWQQ